MKFIVGYTRGYLYSSESDLAWLDVYDSLQEIGEEGESDLDLHFLEKSLIGMGLGVVDFYVLENIRGEMSYKPVSLIDSLKRGYRILRGNLPKTIQDQF